LVKLGHNSTHDFNGARDREPELEGSDGAPLTTPPMTTYGKNRPVIIEEGSEVQNIIARQDFSLSFPTNISAETFEWFMSCSMEFIMLK